MTHGALAVQPAPDQLDIQPNVYGTSIYGSLLTQYVNGVLAGPWQSLGAGFVHVSGQVPIAVVVPNIELTTSISFTYLNGLLEVIPKVGEINYNLAFVSNESPVMTTAKSVGDEAEPFVRYLHELNEVVTRLHERRGSDAQERFMFDTVAPFIEKHKTKAVWDIDLTLDSMPRSAKYFFPYLLGHLEIEDEITSQQRLNFLEKYRLSDDEDVRDGAIEGLGYLTAA
jgi:hypothetical protein